MRVETRVSIPKINFLVAELNLKLIENKTKQYILPKLLSRSFELGINKFSTTHSLADGATLQIGVVSFGDVLLLATLRLFNLILCHLLRQKTCCHLFCDVTSSCAFGYLSFPEAAKMSASNLCPEMKKLG